MAGEWETVPFERLLAEPVRNGIYKTKEFHGRGAKIVNMGELFAYPRLHAVPMKRIELSRSESNRFMLSKGDLMFARRSLVAEGAGKCSIVLEIDEPTTFESSIIRARPDVSKADPLFLYYFFNSTSGLYSLGTIRRQVAVAGITGSDLSLLKIPVPPLPEQRAIARILGTLDDKIELNRRMNATLEGMARSLFKSWFVDFDPVRAKMEGRDTGLPAEIADLFPNGFEGTAVGEAPRGWRVGSILECADLLSGGTPSTSISEYWDGDIPWVSAKDVSAAHGLFVMDTERKITDAGVRNSSTKLLPKNTTIVTARGTVGSYCLLGREMAMNQTNYGLKAKPGVGDFFVFFSLVSLVTLLKKQAYGTIFDTVTTKTFQSAAVVHPSRSLLLHFEQRVTPLMDRILLNIEESRTLAALRDALLPKLISGAVRVGETEEFVKGVA